MTDVSDHFPIFHVSRGMQMSDVDTHIGRRLYSLRNKEEFCHDISTTNWDEIDRATGTQQAFDIFHNRLTDLYNRHFPKVRIKKKYNNKKPWLFEGLKNLSDIRINYMLNKKKLDLFSMKNCTKLTRENSRNSWKWLKSINIMIY